MADLTHVTPDGRPRMVDVGDKPVTKRSATAEGFLSLSPPAHDAVAQRRNRKGDVAFTAELAGIQGAKRTSDLIPLCHPLALDGVDVAFRRRGRRELLVLARVACTGRTGVEMEALTAAALAALTIYDMSKALSHGIEIADLRLLEKRGGRSGVWRRPARRRGGA